MNWKAALICCVLLHAPSVMAADDVYKWKDAEGKVRYTDTPPPGTIPYQNLSRKKVPANTSVTTAEKAKAAAESKAEGAGKAPTEADAKKKAKEQEELAIKKTREENCSIARKNLINYKIGGRIYKVDEKGERIFVGDDEIEAGKQEAQKEVDRWCD